MFYSKQKGFTLIELLIVVAIIAILAAIAVPNFLEAQTRAKVSKCKADMRTLATALESYYVDHNNYVPSSVLTNTGIPFNETQMHPTALGSNDEGGFFLMLSTPVAYIANSFLDDPFTNWANTTTWYNKPNYFMNHLQYSVANSQTFIVWHGRTQVNSNPDRAHVWGTPVYSTFSSRFPGITYGGTQIQWWSLWSVGPDTEAGVFVEFPAHPGTDSTNLSLAYADMATLATARGHQGPFQELLIHEWDSGDDGYTNHQWVPQAADYLISQFMYDPTNGTKSMGNIYRTGGVSLGEPTQYPSNPMTHQYGGWFWQFANAFSRAAD